MIECLSRLADSALSRFEVGRRDDLSEFKRSVYVVGERSVSLRRWLERAAGGIRSANADMSSVKEGEKPSRRKPKVSCSTFIGAG